MTRDMSPEALGAARTWLDRAPDQRTLFDLAQVLDHFIGAGRAAGIEAAAREVQCEGPARCPEWRGGVNVGYCSTPSETCRLLLAARIRALATEAP